jgi:spermidine/putrescine transport system substrate-binding protein
VPEEGCVLFTDNMLMPQKPPNPYAAETMMNYLYDPKVAAKLAAYVNYVSPVDGAQEELAKIDPKLAESELIFPSAETRKRIQPYPYWEPEEEEQIVSAMQKVTGA